MRYIEKTDFKNKNFILKILMLLLCLGALIFASFLIGRYQFTLRTLLDIFASRFTEVERYWEKTLEVVILQVRFPRIILAVLVGGALSISGAYISQSYSWLYDSGR